MAATLALQPKGICLGRNNAPARHFYRCSRQQRACGRAQPPQAFLQRLFGGRAAKTEAESAAEAAQQKQQATVEKLLQSIDGQERGVTTTAEQRAAVLEAVDALRELGAGATTTGAQDLSATWRLLWTTEKESLFILQRAGLFGTAAGDVFQVPSVPHLFVRRQRPEEGCCCCDAVPECLTHACNICIAGDRRGGRHTAERHHVPAGGRLHCRLLRLYGRPPAHQLQVHLGQAAASGWPRAPAAALWPGALQG